MRNQFLMSIGLYLALGCHVVLAQEWVPQKVVGMHYPPLAAHARRQGTVTLECRIGEDGRVQSVKTLSNSDQRSGNLLSHAAEDNATKWKFTKSTTAGSVSHSGNCSSEVHLYFGG